MNFDKIKQAAKDTIRKVSDKGNESNSDYVETRTPSPKTKEPSPIDDFDDFSDREYMERTQTFDIKTALNGLKKRSGGFEGNLSELSGGGDTRRIDGSIVNEFIETNISDLKKDINDSISDIDSGISTLSEQHSKESEKISASLVEIDNKLSALATSTDTHFDAVSVELNSIERKLIDINSTLNSINKLNDSLFDLKNAQMNTKNALGDLDTAFKLLRKKTIAGITVLSIISAVIAILEVLNLLS